MLNELVSFFRNERLIDVNQLSEKDKIFLCDFLANQAKEKNSWSSKASFNYKGQAFRFKQTVFKRQSKKEGAPSVYEFIGGHIGSGAFADVYKIDASLKGTHFKLATNRKHPRVVKRNFPKNGKRSTLEVSNEQIMMQQVSYLHAKTPVFFYDGTSHIVMRYLPGMRFKKLISNERDLFGAPLSTALKLHISMQLLQAVAHKLEAHHIIHPDLSANNVFVHYLGIYFLDFHGALVSKEPKRPAIYVGTSPYSPEAATHSPLSTKSNIYLIGLLLAKLWGVRFDFFHRLDHCEILNVVKKDLTYLTKILLKENGALLRNVIVSMIALDADDRPSAEDACEILSRLLPHYPLVYPAWFFKNWDPVENSEDETLFLEKCKALLMQYLFQKEKKSLFFSSHDKVDAYIKNIIARINLKQESPINSIKKLRHALKRLPVDFTDETRWLCLIFIKEKSDIFLQQTQVMPGDNNPVHPAI